VVDHPSTLAQVLACRESAAELPMSSPADERTRRHHGEVGALSRAGRAALYLTFVLLLTTFGLVVGGATTDCPPDASDCDLGALTAFAGGALALVTGVLGCVVAESVRLLRSATR
jgi:hypothetical protein